MAFLYTSETAVRQELPGVTTAQLTTGVVTTYIKQRSAFVRSALFAYPDSAFLDDPNADPLIEMATRYLAAYDCAIFLKLAIRDDPNSVANQRREEAIALIGDIRDKKLRLTIAAAAGLYGSPILGTRTTTQRTFTMENQDLWGGPSSDGSVKPTGAPDGLGPWGP